MKKGKIALGAFGVVTGFIVAMVSGYSPLNWQWWAAIVPIFIMGLIIHYIQR